eukprot:4412567-Amphidinium_carterae.1
MIAVWAYNADFKAVYQKLRRTALKVLIASRSKRAPAIKQCVPDPMQFPGHMQQRTNTQGVLILDWLWSKLLVLLLAIVATAAAYRMSLGTHFWSAGLAADRPWGACRCQHGMLLWSSDGPAADLLCPLMPIWLHGMLVTTHLHSSTHVIIGSLIYLIINPPAYADL